MYRAIRLAAGMRIRNDNPSPGQLTRLLANDAIEPLRWHVCDGSPIDGPTEQWIEPQPGAAQHHTTSLSVADREGNVVCLTQSLALFGAAGS